MRLDLSSQIVLDRVPQRYYKSDNEFELSALSRFEKVVDIDIYQFYTFSP